MGHVSEIQTRRKTRRGFFWSSFILMVAIMGLLLPSTGMAAPSLLEPADGTHFDYLELAPMLIFDPGVDVQPKWILLATDPEMKSTVRFCRQFVWAATQGGQLKWGCNRWATGADQYGNDVLKALEPGHVYYWQVIGASSPTDKTEVKSDIRSFYIDSEVKQDSISEISDKIMGSVFDDGTQLNLGASAYVNSKVKVGSPSAKRISVSAFALKVKTVGGIDPSSSYIKVQSAAGVRTLKVAKISGGVQAVWKLSAAEKKLKSKRFTYQVFTKSKTNGAIVRSRVGVVVIKSNAAKKTTTSVSPGPVWIPDR